jgi:hypothetical protein
MKKIVLGIWLMLMSIIGFTQTDTTITTFDEVHQGFGNGLNTRTVIDTFYFPSDISGFSSINLHITSGCPAGGCDPWDRFANLKIIHNGEAFEIARYMTPYGKACGWVVDVSDYRSLLTDTVILSSFIDTWVNPAWAVSYDFEFIAGTPAYEYIKVENLWANENVTYGDTSKLVAIDSVYKYIDPSMEKVEIRVVNTGHGQGNTDNAAEFSQKTHKIYVDDVNLYSHLLWRDDCSSNATCNNQSGTWTYNRANWCPGKAVDVEDFDLTNDVTTGSYVKIEYELEDYFNLCSPNTDACTQSTCADCDYNYNGHTEPHYKIHIQLLQKSNDSEVLINSVNELASLNVVLYPNPANNVLNISSTEYIESVQVYSIVGEHVKVNFNDNKIDVSNLPNGVYILNIHSAFNTVIKKFVKR